MYIRKSTTPADQQWNLERNHILRYLVAFSLVNEILTIFNLAIPKKDICHTEYTTSRQFFNQTRWSTLLKSFFSSNSTLLPRFVCFHFEKESKHTILTVIRQLNNQDRNRNQQSLHGVHQESYLYCGFYAFRCCMKKFLRKKKVSHKTWYDILGYFK